MSFIRKIRALLHDRTLQTLLFTVAVLAVVRTPIPDDLEEPRYYDYQKLLWKGNSDVIILGDSRSLVGLSPGIMGSELKQLRIRNFAFAGVGYSAQYLAAGETIWDRTCPGTKIALLGITPRAFRQVSIKSNQFISCSQSLTLPAYCKSRWLGWVKFVWPPLDRPVIEQIVFGADQKYYKAVRYSDGWSEPQAAHIDYQESLNAYKHFKADPISDEIMSHFLDKVREWTDQGIHVYGYRPPTCAEMEALEDDFDEVAFIQTFEKAGGRWISPSEQDLSTYDASHLDRTSSRLYSQRVAQSIRISEAQIAERSPTESAVTQW